MSISETIKQAIEIITSSLDSDYDTIYNAHVEAQKVICECLEYVRKTPLQSYGWVKTTASYAEAAAKKARHDQWLSAAENAVESFKFGEYGARTTIRNLESILANPPELKIS